MNTTVLRVPGPRHGSPVATNRIVQALVRALLAVDAWLAARRQRADDLQALAQMSDYELRDLGLHRLDTLSSSSLFGGGRPRHPVTARRGRRHPGGDVAGV